MTDMLAQSVEWATYITTNLSDTIAGWITASWFVPLVIALLAVSSRKYLHGFLAVFLGIMFGILTRDQAILTILLMLLGFFANIGYHTIFSSSVSELYTPTLDRRAIERYRTFISALRSKKGNEGGKE